MSQKVENLSAMTDAQLRAFLFGNHYDQMSFADVTASYMQTIFATEASSEKLAAESMNAETDTQSSITSLTQKLNTNYLADLALEDGMQPSSMPAWLNDVISGFMVLASIATLNPVLIGISSLGFLAQVTGLQKKAMDALCGDDPNKQALFSFCVAAGEALAGGAASMAGDAVAASRLAATGAEVTAQTAGQLAKNFIKYFLTYLGQTLEQTNFWPEFFQGPCKMSDEDAAIAGMFVGVAFGISSCVAAGASEDGLSQMLRAKINAMGPSGLQLIRYITTASQLMGDGFQVGAGADELGISNQFKQLANFERDVMAPVMSKLSLVQTVSSGIDSVITTTQNLLQILSDDSTTINQTFSSFADMFRPAQQG